MFLNSCHQVSAARSARCARHQSACRGPSQEVFCQQAPVPSQAWLGQGTVQLGVGHSRRGRQVLAGAGNLGQLQGLAATTADEAAWTAQWVAPQAMANREMYVDPANFVSGFILLLLLAISFQRILGLDRWVAELMLQQQERKREELQQARQRLERSLKPESGEDDGSNN